MRRTDLFRAGLALVLLAFPSGPSRITGEGRSRAVAVATRLLVARLLLQAGLGFASARRDITVRRGVALADTAVEALHGASMLALGLLMPRYRRMAISSATVATACAVADYLAADRSNAYRVAQHVAEGA